MSSLHLIFRIWRRFALVALTMFLLTANAFAEHDPLPPAQFELIGFSENGRYLAYETFGFYGADGLGSAAVHVLDLVGRRWVIGSPVTVDADANGQSLAGLRARARARAGFIIEDLHITRPAVLAAMIGDGEPRDDAHSMRFGLPRADGGQVVEPFKLEIAAYNVQAAASCEDVMDGSPRGFSLSIERFGENSAIYQDGPLPRSRGCPDEYHLMAVVVPYQAQDMAHAVALISVRNVGSDGVRRSFVPVPLGNPDQGTN